MLARLRDRPICMVLQRAYDHICMIPAQTGRDLSIAACWGSKRAMHDPATWRAIKDEMTAFMAALRHSAKEGAYLMPRCTELHPGTRPHVAGGRLGGLHNHASAHLWPSGLGMHTALGLIL